MPREQLAEEIAWSAGLGGRECRPAGALRNGFAPWLWAVMVVVAVGVGLPVRGQTAAAGGGDAFSAQYPTIVNDVAAVGAYGEDRSAGTPAAAKAAEYYALRLAEVTGQQVWRQRFTVTVPVVKEAYATSNVSDEKTTIYPWTPAGGQAPAIANNVATADVIYGGRGQLGELAGKVVKNHWVALDLRDSRWTTVASLGAKGIIFLGKPDAGAQSFLDKQITVPVGVPRFYVDDAGLAEKIRQGAVTSLTIHESIRWMERPAQNLLCLIPGRQNTPNLANASNGWTDQLIVLQARYDATSEVLGKAPGAEQSVNAALVVALAEKVAHAPDHSSILVVLTEGDEWLLKGTRVFLTMIRREYGVDAKRSIREVKELADAAATSADEAAQVLQGLHRLVDQKDIYALQDKLVREAVRDQLDRQTANLEEELQRLRLKRDQEHGAFSEADQHRQAELEGRKNLLLTATTSVSRQAPLEEAQAVVLLAAGELIGPWTTELQRRADDRDAKHGWADIRYNLGERQPMVHLEVQLTSGADHFGFFAPSNYNCQADLGGRMAEFARPFRTYLKQASATAQAAGQAFHCQFDEDSLATHFTLESFFPVHRGFSSDASLIRGLPAAAFATERDGRALLGTPNDSLANLQWQNLLPQVQDLQWLLLGSTVRGTPGILVDPLYYARAELPNNTSDHIVTLFERTLGETVPRLGAPEHLIGIEQKQANTNNGWIPALPGLHRFEWELTHVDGTTTFLGVAKNHNYLQAFRFADDGLPTRCLSQIQTNQTGVVSEFQPDIKNPSRALVFECRRLDLFDLYDPRYMDTLDRVQILDAKDADNPQDMPFSANYIRDGIGAVFMPAGVPWQLLAAKGDVARRLLLLNADEKHPQGRGFNTVDVAEIGPLSWRNANDLYWLDGSRKANLEHFGISNEVITELHDDKDAKGHVNPHDNTAKYLAEGRAAQQRLDYSAWLDNAAAAWSLESQVYNNLIATSNGIIHGVIFLLLGIIPFSYFLERLIIGASNVYKQIGGFALIFALMVGGLWFHPAFKISSAPIMILLAFLILILSSTVVYILFGKFEEEIARLRGAASGSHSANLKRGAVLGAAVRLGLSNMRRRGTRTTLTLITLILLTFTLLCFTSVSEALHLLPRLVAEAPNPAPKGILLRQRGWKGMPLQIENTVAALAGPGGQSAQRWWLSSEAPETPWELPVKPVDGASRTFLATGFLGLAPNEQLFQTADLSQVLPGWSRMAAGEAVCYLPDEMQADTDNGRGLKVGDRVDVLGQALTIAGFFDAKTAQKLQQLNGDGVMPIDPAGNAAQPGTTAATSPEDIAALSEQSYQFLNPSQVAILPADVVHRLNGRLTSIMVLPANPVDITPKAEELARRSTFTVFASDGSQVLSYNAAASSRPEHLDKVLVPMIIAAVIVLNTMLGAVSERTKEIHVYTSLGLAPAHVGTLFLAEAAALGTLGVVFGYIFGQGLATILTKFQVLGGVTLNYSSMSAIITMGLILGLVMLSALWPARTATRVAAPSLQRDWKLPQPHGDILQVDLPFTVNQVAARGVCAFLEEFFATVSQAGSGRFTADHIQAFQQDAVRGITCRIWLAPYDLGVIQAFWLAVHPTPEPNVFEVRLTLVREAGSPSAWHRLNRPFLVEVRKQFLLWRAVSPELVQSYLSKSATMFAAPQQTAPPSPFDPAPAPA